jgi:NhaC family Na+:H+ antiporter
VSRPMDVLIAFAVFLGSMAACLISGISMVPAIILGWCAFVCASVHRGVGLGKLMKVSAAGVRDSLIVVLILLLIGMLTASWRACGTIMFFVYYGMALITPRLFILITFLLCALLSYAIGTSFGVAGTMGVIFMAIARSGGANEIVTAGAVMSGIYFGDCCSPAASSMALTAAMCHTDAYAHSRRLLKANILPVGLCVFIYGALSPLFPLASVNTGMMDAIRSQFNVDWWVSIPAVIMLVLPVLKVKTKLAMALSVLSAAVVGIFGQGISAADFLTCLITGYHRDLAVLGSILNGGGLVSMLEICVILAVSSTYSGIFSLSGMLDGLRDRLSVRMERYGAFPVMLAGSLLFGAVFCNQTIAILMCAALLGPSYEKRGLSGERLALDIGCSAVDLCGLIPWCIACSVPLKMFGVGAGALPLSFLLYLLPLTCLVKDLLSRGKAAKTAGQ